MLTKRITFYATSVALAFLAMLFDRAITSFLPINMAIIVLTVIFTIGLTEKKMGAAFASGLIFGCSSFLVAICTANEMFINPLVSILPRLPLGFMLFGVYKLMQKLTRNVKNKKIGEYVSLGVACALTACLNTALVLPATSLFEGATYTGDVVKSILLINALPEAIIPAVLVPSIIWVLRRAMRIDGALSVSANNANNEEISVSVEEEGEEMPTSVENGKNEEFGKETHKGEK